MHLLSVYQATNSVQDLLFYLYRLPLPLTLSDILYLYLSTLLLLSDTHTAWIDSTFSIYLRIQLQIYYSNALSNPKLPTQNCCILYSTQKEYKQELANGLTD